MGIINGNNSDSEQINLTDNAIDGDLGKVILTLGEIEEGADDEKKGGGGGGGGAPVVTNETNQTNQTQQQLNPVQENNQSNKINESAGAGKPGSQESIKDKLSRYWYVLAIAVVAIVALFILLGSIRKKENSMQEFRA